MGHTRVMTETESGLHQNSGKHREFKISKNWRSWPDDLQDVLNRMLISRSLDDNREQALLIKPLNNIRNGDWLETLMRAAASRMYQHKWPPRWNPDTLKTGTALFHNTRRDLDEPL